MKEHLASIEPTSTPHSFPERHARECSQALVQVELNLAQRLEFEDLPLILFDKAA